MIYVGGSSGTYSWLEVTQANKLLASITVGSSEVANKLLAPHSYARPTQGGLFPQPHGFHTRLQACQGQSKL